MPAVEPFSLSAITLTGDWADAQQRNVDVLPSKAGVLARLAHGMGYGDGGRQAFEEERLRHARHVRRVAERVFFEMPDVDERGAWERR